MKEVEIMALCHSEKEGVCIGCGTYIDTDKELIKQLDNDWLWDCMAEAFWENSEEYEPGIRKAMQLLKNNPMLTYKQALYAVFGDFIISFETNGENIDFKLDSNNLMYGMLENLSL